MHVVIMGAGAVGGYFGGVLANQGEQVTFIARGNHLKKLMTKDYLLIAIGVILMLM